MTAQAARLPAEIRSGRIRLAWLAMFAGLALAIGVVTGGTAAYVSLACAATAALLAAWAVSREFSRQARARRCQWHSRVVDRQMLDERSVQLLAAAQQAIGRITGSGVFARGGLDDAVSLVILRDFEWHVATLLRDVSELHARADDTRKGTAGGHASVVAAAQASARSLVYARVADDVRRVEELADDVQAADRAIRDHELALRLAELNGAHLDLMARALADGAPVAGLTELTDRAAAAAAPCTSGGGHDAEVLALPPGHSGRPGRMFEARDAG